jgi:hypothetical protein
MTHLFADLEYALSFPPDTILAVKGTTSISAKSLVGREYSQGGAGMLALQMSQKQVTMANVHRRPTSVGRGYLVFSTMQLPWHMQTCLELQPNSGMNTWEVPFTI